MSARFFSIEMSEDNMKWVLSDPGRKRIHAFSVIRLAGVPLEQHAELLRGSLRKHRIQTKGLRTTLVMGRHQVTVKMLRLPTVKDEEIGRMAEFQAIRHIPFNREEIVVDYEKIAVDGKDYTVIILAIVPKSIMEHCLAVVKKANLTPEQAVLSSQTAVKAHLTSQSKGMHVSTDCLVDIDCTRSGVDICHSGKLIFTRSIAMGLHELKQDPNAASRFTEELQATLRAYRKQDAAPAIQNIVFTRPVQNLSGWSVRIKDDLGLACEMSDSIKSYLWQGKPEEQAVQDLEEYSFTSLAGAMTRDAQATINLLPEEWRQKRYGTKRRREWAIAAVATAGLLFSLGFTGAARLAVQKDYLNFLNARLLETEPRAKQVRARRERLNAVREFSEGRKGCLESLTELYRVVPQGVYLSLFTYEGSEKISLRGTADELSTVFQTRDALEQSNLFEKVAVKFATKKKRIDKEFVDFQIECPLKDLS